MESLLSFLPEADVTGGGSGGSGGIRRNMKTVVKNKKEDAAPDTATSSTAATASSSTAQQATPPDPSSSASSSATAASATASATAAQILSRSTLPSLSTLDAGDVIECYALFRKAKLSPTDASGGGGGAGGVLSGGGERRYEEDYSSGAGGGDSSGSGSSTSRSSNSGGGNLVRIQKSALAFRYRPPSWSSLDDVPLNSIPHSYETKRSYELTLEYGPARLGSALDRESLPLVVGGLSGGGGGEVRYPGDGLAHVPVPGSTGDNDGGSSNGDDNGGGSNNGGSNNNNDDKPQELLYPDERFVTWDNEARIYYRTRIHDEDWVGAYYVAPISGAVLTKILDYAIEYAERHRRYQPFEVVGIGGDEDVVADGGSSGSGSGGGGDGDDKQQQQQPQQPRTIIRSSSSDDFVWSVFDALASMYVDIRPILAPPRQRVRFFVRGWNDVTKLSGIVSGTDLELPGVPVDSPLLPSGGSSSGGGGGVNDGGEGVEGGGRDDEEQQQQEGSATTTTTPAGRNVASLAADFYTRFYDCANAIRTGDYSKWEQTKRTPTESPTASPTMVVEPKAALHDPTEEGSGGRDGPTGAEQDDLGPPVDGVHHEDTVPIDQDTNNQENTDDDDGFEFDDPPNRALKQDQEGKHKHKGGTNSTNSTPLPTANAAPAESEPGLSDFENQEVVAVAKDKDEEAGVDEDHHDDDEEATNESDDGEEQEEPNADEQIDEASAAVEAAQKALDAANNAAAISPSDGTAAAAAQEAADAAKKAAEASSLAKATAAMDALFSADGGQMMQVLGTCWSDPKYGIRVDRRIALPIDGGREDDRSEDEDEAEDDDEFEHFYEKNSDPDGDPQAETPEQRYATVSTTHVYLFVDGSSYYRLNLTPPFWDATPSIQTMPQPKVYEAGRAQILDRIFFYGIIGGFIFGMVVLLHVVGILRIDSRLKFKKFFHPAHPGIADGRDGYLSASQLARRDSGVFTDDGIESESFDTDEAEERWELESEKARQRGGGQAHPFDNPNAIPAVFMGKSSPTVQVKRSRNVEEDVPSWDGDFELSEMKSNGNGESSRRGSTDQNLRGSSNGDDLDFDQADAMGGRIDTMKAAMDEADLSTPQKQKRGRSFNRGESGRSTHNDSNGGSNRRRRSPVDMVPLPAQVRMARDPSLVDFPGLKSTTPVAMPAGASRQSSTNGHQALDEGEMVAVNDAHTIELV